MPQGGIGYQSTSSLPNRLQNTAPTDPMRGAGGILNSGQRPGTSGQAAVFTDRAGVYNRQGNGNDIASAKATNKMPQI